MVSISCSGSSLVSFFLYAFPLEAWYDNTIGRHLVNTFRLSLSRLGTTLMLAAVNALFPALIEYAKALAILLGANGCIYLKTILLGKLLFPKQREKKRRPENRSGGRAEPENKSAQAQFRGGKRYGVCSRGSG